MRKHDRCDNIVTSSGGLLPLLAAVAATLFVEANINMMMLHFAAHNDNKQIASVLFSGGSLG